MKYFNSLSLVAILAGLCTAAHAETTCVIDIGGPMDELFIRQGWYQPEGPYPQFGPIWHESPCRWAQQGATVRIPVFPDAVSRVELRAEVRGDDKQRLHCFVNGTRLAEFPISADLLYRFDVPPATCLDQNWADLRLETLHAAPVPSDSRDLRLAVDWIRISADAEDRLFIAEALKDKGLDTTHMAHDQAPRKWRMRYDPNNVGDTHAPRRFRQIDYDDSAWEFVPTSHVLKMRRGDVVWYRAWVIVEQQMEATRQQLQLPGAGAEKDGLREVWVNGRKLMTTASNVPLHQQAASVLNNGFNLIVVKIMQGQLPRPSGDELVEPPHFEGTWSPQEVVCRLTEIVLKDTSSSVQRLIVTLIDPVGTAIGTTEKAVAKTTPDGRTVKLQAEWPLSEYGEYTLRVQDNTGREQHFPVHFLGLHLFHWGWYSAAGGTTWTGFKPTSNDHLDELFPRLSDWGRPHHSICWGGAILAPGTGFHRSEQVNYIAKFREAIATGSLDFVGMPFPPRNICTDFGESLVRSVRRSRALYESQLNAKPHRFYSHDATMTPRLPQIMRLCGYDTYCIAENWWGQGRSVPNSRDCYFLDADGTEVRILDSWYHGISPVEAARRAVQQGKPAVLCNEEFACLDRTVFLDQQHLDQLAKEGIFLKPVSLSEYQSITETFAREVTYEGEDALCYKGWTGGGEGEFEFEKANRLLETRLVALENLVAFSRWLGHEVEANPIDQWWDKSFRAHECHFHWGNGYPDLTNELKQATSQANQLMRDVSAAIASDVNTKAGDVVVFNSLGFKRDGLVSLEVSPVTQSLRSLNGKRWPVQKDPDNAEAFLAWLPDLPSCGYRTYRAESDSLDGHDIDAAVTGNEAVLDNGVIRVNILATGAVQAITDIADSTDRMVGGHQIFFAKPKNEAPSEPLSSAHFPLNMNHYSGLVTAGPPKLLSRGPVLSSVLCTSHVPDYSNVKVMSRISLVKGERQVRVRLTLAFAEPTIVAPTGGPGPHEGVYVPGIFVSFPMPERALPLADMAYCTTDRVLSSTNQETFSNMPFRNGTFNTLSLAGPNSGEYAILTRGLPDFFVLRRPVGCLGMSLGVGTESGPFKGEYTHEYAIYVPEQGRAAHIAFKAARSFLVDPVAVIKGNGQGRLSSELSFFSANNDRIIIPGLEMKHGTLSVRMVNLSEQRGPVDIETMVPLSNCEVLPEGDLQSNRLELGPKGIRELRISTTERRIVE